MSRSPERFATITIVTQAYLDEVGWQHVQELMVVNFYEAAAEAQAVVLDFPAVQHTELCVDRHCEELCIGLLHYHIRATAPARRVGVS